MKDNTPYRTRPPSEIEHERCCMRDLFRSAPVVPLIYEAFGGIGLAARIWLVQFPQTTVISSDLDKKCVDQYNAMRLPNAHCSHVDALVSLQETILPKEWGASLDFNKLTIFDLRGRKEGKWKIQLLEEVFKRSPTWVQFTDSAVRYLHLNWHRYQLPKNNLVDYISAVSQELHERYHYSITTYSNYYAASYFLCQPSS